MEAQKGRYEYAATMDKQKYYTHAHTQTGRHTHTHITSHVLYIVMICRKLWEEEYCQLMSKLSDYKERLKSSQAKLGSSQDTNRKVFTDCYVCTVTMWGIMDSNENCTSRKHKN